MKSAALRPDFARPRAFPGTEPGARAVVKKMN
jgi:hypothetical protein